MKSLDSEENDLIKVGDLNHSEVDWPNSACQKDEDNPAQVFLESVRDGLLVQHVKEATRWREGQTPSTNWIQSLGIKRDWYQTSLYMLRWVRALME